MYKVKEKTNLQDYIFDTLPYNEKIDLNEIRRIEKTLKDYTNGQQQIGITYEEACKFLDWITYNARAAVTDGIYERAMTEPLTGTCGPTQRINVIILQKIGLDVRPFNMGECVGRTPMTQEDKQKIENGWYSTNIRHSVALVNLPIKENGKIQVHKFLLDPSVRQFCLKENCNKSLYWNEDRLQKGYVAPHPAYFWTEQYLKEQGQSEEKIKKSDYVARVLINRGYMELTEETAKIYGDAFARAGIRWQFRDTELKMTGLDYIKEFENRKMKILNDISQYDEYTKTPLEIKEEKSFFKKIKEFFTRKSKKNQKCFPVNTVRTGNTRNNTLKNYKVDNYIHPNVNEITQVKDDRQKEIELR